MLTIPKHKLAYLICWVDLYVIEVLVEKVYNNSLVYCKEIIIATTPRLLTLMVAQGHSTSVPCIESVFVYYKDTMIAF